MRVAKFDRYDMTNNPLDDTAAFTLWFSGCNLMCEDCQNPILWNSSRGNEYGAEYLANIILRQCSRFNMKYVVLLGGEPLQQSRRELLSLCSLLYDGGLKIWLYTGYDINDVPDDLKPLLYTIKCGRYIKDLRQDGFPISSNQKVYRQIAGGLVDITEKFRR